MAEPDHAGVSTDDPRNAGPIAFFRPEDLTREQLKTRIEAIAARVENAATKAQILERAAKVDDQAFRPPAPLCVAPGAFAWREIAYAAHPDLVDAIREANAALPQDCLCLLWGRPALVHPKTGVIFAVAVGSIGILARLPARYQPSARKIPSGFDPAGAGPDWRLVDLRDDAWGAAAYAHAAGTPG
jgi:hypothetical protein